MTNEAHSVLTELRQRGDEIRRAELRRARSRMGRLTPEQEGVVDSLTAVLVARLLHHTVIQIEQLTEEGRAEAMAIVRALLGLT